MLTRLNTLRAITSNANGYKRLRDELRTIDPPCIPWIGVYMMELSLLPHNENMPVRAAAVAFADTCDVQRILRRVILTSGGGSSARAPYESCRCTSRCVCCLRDATHGSARAAQMPYDMEVDSEYEQFVHLQTDPLARVKAAGEWRPHKHHSLPPAYKDTMRTLLLLAKSRC